MVKDESFMIIPPPMNQLTYGRAAYEFYVYIDRAWRESGWIEINDNDWHHLKGTYSSSTRTVSLYVDGQLERKNLLTGLSGYKINVSPYSFTIGTSFGPNQSIIDEVRISTITN